MYSCLLKASVMASYYDVLYAKRTPFVHIEHGVIVFVAGRINPRSPSLKYQPSADELRHNVFSTMNRFVNKVQSASVLCLDDNLPHIRFCAG